MKIFTLHLIMANLVPLSDDKKPFVTADGSISYYNLTYCEAYHAKSVGAYTESLHKYVYASGILDLLKKRPVWLLDICFGLGYNIAVLINEYLKKTNLNKLNILSIEKDPGVVELVKNMHFLWPVNAYNVLRKLLDNKNHQGISFNLIIDDLIYVLKYLDFQFDIIFFDPFSKSKNPEIWNAHVFEKLYSLLRNDGNIVTYACSKKIREEFQKSGFICYDTDNLPSDFQKGTRLEKNTRY